MSKPSKSGATAAMIAAAAASLLLAQGDPPSFNQYPATGSKFSGKPAALFLRRPTIASSGP
jgi:hypothetical protein